MSLDVVVDLQISVEATAPAQASFNIPMLLAYHTDWAEFTREYTDIESVAEDFASTSVPYRMAQKLLSQTPHPNTFKIGRRATAFDQAFDLAPLNAVDGFVYAFVINDAIVSYTNSSDTLDSIVDAFVTQLTPAVAEATSAAETYALVDGDKLTLKDNAGNIYIATFEAADAVDLSVTTAAEIVAVLDVDWAAAPTTHASTTTVVITSTGTPGASDTLIFGGSAAAKLGLAASHTGSGATGMSVVDNINRVSVTTDTSGELLGVDLQGMDPGDLTYDDITADPGLAADLDALLALDSAWYGTAIDSSSPAEIEALAGWIETQPKISVVRGTNTDIADATAIDDIANTLKDNSYKRTWGIFARNVNDDFRDTAWLSGEIVKTPGSSTWAFKTLIGITVDVLKGGQDTAIQSKNCSSYTEIGGRNVTFESLTPFGEYADIQHFVDWLHARIQESVFGALSTPDKVPYTDVGVEVVLTAIRNVLRQGVGNGGLRANPAPVATAPLVADIPVADRANRRLPDIIFTAELAGAIHKTVIRGKVSV